MASCNTPSIGRRRSFWTTQLCDTFIDECGNECGRYGLQLYCPEDPEDFRCKEHDTPTKTRSIRTNDWVKSLALNILLTNGRRADAVCGWKPGTRGGHWSDSYRNGIGEGSTAGSLVRDLHSHGRVADAISELRAIVEYDMQKMVTYGIAQSVEVEVTYKGANTAQVDITIYGVDGETNNVGMTATRNKNSWLWNV